MTTLKKSKSSTTLEYARVPPKCVWLDKDHSGGLVATALSLYMTDFSGGSLRQYLEKNGKREDIGVEALQELNPLEFNNTNGEFVQPDPGIDRQQRAYPDGANSKNKRNENSTSPDRYSPNSNHLPNHLTVSYISSHSARRLCESDTSQGADFVAINDNESLFCDMTRKELIDVCDDKNTLACFDLETKQMRDVGAKVRKRDLSYSTIVPRKTYKIHVVWGKK